MKLIVGLGNPGSAYSNSRHNIGFMAVKALAAKNKIVLKRGFFSRSLTGRFKSEAKQVILAQPLTFMNLSGSGIKPLVKKHKISLQDLLVICDDIDLDFGVLRLRPAGSSGGHRGLESVIESLGSKEFARLRIGVGRPHEKADAADYVLAPFRKSELKDVREIIEIAVSCAESWITQGISETMNNYNKSLPAGRQGER